MILDRAELAPDLLQGRMANGMVYDGQTGHETPGKILQLWAEVRKRVGIVELKKKNGMKFETRASTDLMDKLSQACNDLGVLVYPASGSGKGLVVEDGTLADVELTIRVQSIEDGSYLELYGYGQGADTQDKAGGKAGTYAFKQALIQALLAGGTKAPKSQRIPDTDDTDTPIEGGVRAKTGRPKAPTFDEVSAELQAATDEPGYRSALAKLKVANAADQVKLAPIAREARARCIVDNGTPAPQGSTPTQE
jgi:hypothetical protein